MENAVKKGTPEGSDQHTQKHSCSTCARRKVRCDRQQPCANCARARCPCSYSSSVSSPRPRKRHAEENLLARLHRYEELLRKNNIDFTPSDGWIHAGISINQPKAKTDKLQLSEESLPTSRSEAQAQREETWWTELSDELRNASKQQLPSSRVEEDFPLLHESSTIASPDAGHLLFGAAQGPGAAKCHPSSMMIFRLWQFFLDSVNPLIKIIHAPTLQRKILKAVDNLQEVPKNLDALLFSVYTISVASMSNAECISMFARERPSLLMQFRSATQQALIDADFLRRTDLTILQALLLFMLSDPDSIVAFTLSPVAIRLAQSIGISGNYDPNVSVFENEMRIRMWWQLLCWDARLTMGRPGVVPILEIAEVENIRLPLNVNDSDLYPEMSDPPTEYSRVTEMSYCLLKYDAYSVIRRFLRNEGIFTYPKRWTESSVPAFTKDKLISEIESLHEQKYLQYCDPKVPLHHLIIIIARLGMNRLKLRRHHPRRNPNWSDPEETEILFLNSVRLIEYDNLLRKTKFAQQLLRYLTAKTQVDALICVLTELRRRATGDLVETAWREVEIVFDDHPRLLEDTDNALYVSIGDLTMKAWKTRIATAKSLPTPDFILSLQKTRSNDASSVPKAADQFQPFTQDALEIDHHATEPLTSNLESAWATDLPSMNWEFWEDLLREPELDRFGQQTLGYDFG